VVGRGRRGCDPVLSETPPLIVLGAGPAQLGAYRAARRLGVPTVACDVDPAALCLRLGLADRAEPVSTMDEGGVREVAERHGAGGLIAPGTDGPVLVAARVATALGLPHPVTSEAAARATNKRRQHEVLAAHGVPQPRAWLDPPPVLAARVVVKPSAAQGQRGLTVVEQWQELQPAVERARTASRDTKALVQELVDGQEVTVNAFSAAGRFHPLTVTDRERAAAFGVATAHLWPPASDPAAAAAVAERAVEALGITDGPTYTQIVLGPDGPRVLEVAARLGGGHDAELCQAALGVDLAALAVRAALGHVAAPVPETERPAVVRFLLGPPGTLAAVDGLDDARQADGVLDAVVYRAPGERIAPVAVGADRAGFVLATGATRTAADQVARAAAGRIVLRVRP
jgi:biotin carboxylase